MDLGSSAYWDALDAVLHCPSTFTTMDVVDVVRRRRPNSEVARMSNQQVGRFLSSSRGVLFIEDTGRSTARGRVWHRQPVGEAARMVRFLLDSGRGEQALAYLQRIRPDLQEQFAKLVQQRRTRDKARAEPDEPVRPKGAATPISDASASWVWNDPRLAVKTDAARRRNYRLLQSWYRETQLHVAPGRSASGRLVGSMLDVDAAVARPDLNFLDADIAAYVDQRVPEILAAGGTVDANRLRRNLLSSQPLCFNLFGGLRAEPAAAARVLADVLRLPIAEVEEITVEYAPLPAREHLGDRTAFDALVTYRTADGARGFVGVETKYTEPFSPTVYTAEHNPRYAAWTTPEHGFRMDAVGKLQRKEVNQLWRNAMLAVSLRSVDEYEHGHVAVLAGDGDKGAAEAIDLLTRELTDPDQLIRSATLEHLVTRAGAEAELASCAGAFRRRYLDLAPVQAGSA